MFYFTRTAYPAPWWKFCSSYVKRKSKISGLLSPSACSYHSSESHEQWTHSALPQQSRVVICGGGIIGFSIAYHLAKLGWTDVVLLEKGRLTCGTTWHSPGLVSQLNLLKASNIESRLHQYSVQLYEKLQADNHSLEWKRCGSLNLARTKDRMLMYRRLAAAARTRGVECDMITPKQAVDLNPLIKHEDLEGALWIPGDGVINSTNLASALYIEAKNAGIRFIERCQVKEVLVTSNVVSGVQTNLGEIKCDYFINCAGQWSREIGEMSEPTVRVPLHSCEHYYITTTPVDGMHSQIPVTRDFDGRVYFREWNGGILAGGFELEAKPIFHSGIPDKYEFELLPADWDHFQVLLEQMLIRIPSMHQVEVKKLVNGAESFTPDGRMILGEAPEIENYYVAAGMCGSGVGAAGGVGSVMADMIVHGEAAPMDLWAVDVRRFVDLHNNKKYLQERVKESLGLQASVTYPDMELRSSRKLRTSPLYTRLEAKGAVFGQSMGFERALYFKGPQNDEFFAVEVPPMACFGKPHWFDIVANEYWACREGVCLIDMSSFSKIDLKSVNNDVVDFLQYLCSNDIDKPVGTVIHTGMQNQDGGYENDCSILRLDENHFIMISPTSQQTRCQHWLKTHQPQNSSVLISNITSMYTVLNLIGPRARELLAELSDVSTKAFDFPQMTCKTINVGYASGILAMRLTHSGEDGFCLYVPSESALYVYDTLMEYGHDYGIQNAGYYALRSLRMEKFFAYWGQDLSGYTLPFECQREFRVKLKKDIDFIGKEALLKWQKSPGVEKKFVQLFVDGHSLEKDPWPWGGEPLYRNGRFAGMTTSGAYGYAVNSHVCLGYVYDFDETTKKHRLITNDFVLKNAHFEIDIAGQRFPCRVGLYAPKTGSSVHDTFVPARIADQAPH